MVDASLLEPGGAREATQRSPESPVSLMIVEDEAIVALDVKTQLEELGYRVVAVTESGADALQQVREQRPALVLMDIVLRGEMDGIETANRIRRGFGTPVVFVTSFSDPETVQRAARAGAYGYLTKPFQIRELRAAIEVALYKARMERQLGESERWFASTLRCIDDGVVVTEPDSRIRFLNPAAEQMTGWDSAEAVGHALGEVLKFADAAGHISPDESATVAMRENRVVGIDLAKSLRRRDGRPLPVDESAAPVQDERGQRMGAVVVLRDATQRLRFEQLLRESEARFRRAFDFAPVGMALVSIDGHFMQVNSALCRFLGYSATELLTLRHDELTYEADVQREHRCLLDLLSGSSEVEQLEKRYRDRGGERTLWALANISLLREGDTPVCYLYQIHDLTERKDAEYRLAKLAYDDPLTGLRNRAGLRDDMDHLITEARRRREQLAVVFLDLDRFKQINDSLGHEAGDDLLRTVARRLRAVLREEDSIARLGGDEFVLVLPGLHGMDSVTRVTEKVRATVSKPMRVLSREVVVTPSMGISLFPIDANDANSLLRCADSALYLAKAEGRNRVVFFKPELTQQANERLAMESALRKAMARRELYLEYQPLVKLCDGTIIGFEALLRWNRSGLVVSPAEFIPVAEDAGLIEGIGEWVLAQSCHFAAGWPLPVAISVNCSARQFREDTFANKVNDTLRDSCLAPQRLWLELTEGILLRSDDRQIARLRSLKQLGVKLAVDDYGTGYSPLAYLKTYAPDGLKISSIFIADIAHDRNSAAIVSATVAMGHGLGIKVIAEGVETSAQAEELSRLGCELVQGYLYAKPMPEGAVADVLRKGRLSGADG